jgi:colicin import membrane protein
LVEEEKRRRIEAEHEVTRLKAEEGTRQLKFVQEESDRIEADKEGKEAAAGLAEEEKRRRINAEQEVTRLNDEEGKRQLDFAKEESERIEVEKVEKKAATVLAQEERRRRIEAEQEVTRLKAEEETRQLKFVQEESDRIEAENEAVRLSLNAVEKQREIIQKANKRDPKQKLAFNMDAATGRNNELDSETKLLKEQEQTDASSAAENRAVAFLEEHKDGAILKTKLNAEIEESKQMLMSSLASDADTIDSTEKEKQLKELQGRLRDAESRALTFLEERKNSAIQKTKLILENDESKQKSSLVTETKAVKATSIEGATVSTVVEESPQPVAEGLTDYRSVQNLRYRELQKECKSRDLEYKGNTESLRKRLLEHEGHHFMEDTKIEARNDKEVRGYCTFVIGNIDSRVVLNPPPA